MPEGVLNLADHYGLIGASWSVLIAAIVALWLRLVKEQDDGKKLTAQYAEDSRQTTAAMVELTMFIRGKQK